MPPVKPTGTQSRAGEDVTPRPTPTQEENDLAAAGVHIEVHDWDGTPLQHPHGEPDRPELPPPTQAQAPAITSLSPNTAVVGGPDLTMTVVGSGFTSGSVIVWNGSDEPTTVVSATQVSTGVKPSTASGPWAIPVAVRNGDKMSNSLSFQFTEAAGTRGTKR